MYNIVKAIFASLIVITLASPSFAAGVSPADVAGAKTVNAVQAKELFDKGVLFLDVRKDSDWDAGRVPEAEHLELKKIFTADSFGGIVKKDDAVVIYCNGEKCLRSSVATAKAVTWGYTNLYYFRDGFPAWKAAGYPTE